ncbi:sensor histidine kinase [Roseateles sp. BYS87W]|uniref:histidine kinase n=1 Tax=Pelomonas baiyunensis TaxID=3299026 RepID=A0ABW7H2T3_9BURK
MRSSRGSFGARWARMALRRALQGPRVLLLIMGLMWALPAAWAQAPLEPAASSAAAPPPGLLELLQARFVAADGTAQAVALPDTWGLRGLPIAGRGTYLLDLPVSGPLNGAWALYLPRVSSEHRILLNGVVLQSERARLPRQHPEPRLVALPLGLLQPGLNRLEVEVNYGIRGGLSRVWAGPVADVRALAFQAHVREARLPQALNLVALTLALVMLLLWLQQRNDGVLGSFALLACVACARNLTYYDQGFSLPAPGPDLLFFGAQVVSAYLLTRLALAASDLQLGRWRTLADAFTVVLLVLGTVAAGMEAIVTARRWLYPLLALMLLPAVGLLLRQAWRQRGWPVAAVALGAVLVSAAGAHDYLYGLGHLSIEGRLLLPFASPIFLGVFGLWRLRGLMLALARGDRLNRLLESRIERRTRALHRANGVKSAFLATASHDLRQPILAVSLMVGLARQRATDADQLSLLDRAQQGLDGLQRFMSELLDLSRLNTGAVKTRVSDVPLQPVLDEVALHLRTEAEAKGLVLRVRPTAAVVRTDPTLLAQVLRNLAVNAVRHTPRGGVLVRARLRRTQVWLEVWDTGPGIPEAQREAIFDEFVRLGPGTGGTPGWGLGLAIVRQSLALLRHPLELDSWPGKGSRFRVRLPRV